MDIGYIQDHDSSAVEAFLASRMGDGSGPALSEHKWIRRLGADDSRILLCSRRGVLVAYLQAAWHEGSGDAAGHWGVEVVTDWERHAPEARALVARAAADLTGTLRVWATDPTVARHVSAWGFEKVRSLLVLRRASGAPRPWAPAPDGIRIEAFDRERDAAEWLLINNSAFAGHPENGSLTMPDLDERMSQSWFDPAGFLVAREDGRLIGFCWTKVHPDRTGEIYIIATAPEAAGRGIGRALLDEGLEHLEGNRGVSSVVLYVEADNEPALALYRLAGFERERELAQYAPG